MMNNDFSNNGEISIRSLNGSEDKSRIVCGYAVKFESESQNIGFIEIIHRGAITEETIMNSDIYALLNHNTEQVLARSRYGEGSLALELRDDGLYYEFEAPNTVAGDELIEHLNRREITTSSFGFTVPIDGSGDKWYWKDKVLYREIFKIEKLYDVSPVYEPAYLATSCSKRAKDMVDASKEINQKFDNILSELDNYLIK